MNIICCVKQVVDTNLQIGLSKNGEDIDRSNLTFVMNPYDEFALEESLRIKEKLGEGEVTLITYGRTQAEEVLRTGLAMGADRGIHVVDDTLTWRDPLVTARILAKVIGRVRFDLIFCGRQAVDDDAFQTGASLAVLLGIPEISLASKVTISDDKKRVVVEKNIEGGIRLTLESSLPALLTAQKGLNEARYASLPGIMAAKKKPIQVIPVEALGIDTSGGIDLVEIALPKTERKQQIFEGDPKEIVPKVVRLLKEEAKVL